MRSKRSTGGDTGGVVAVGVSERQAVLEQQHRRACRVQTAHAEVGAQAEAFLVAGIDARHFAHGFVDRENARGLEDALVDYVGRARDRRQPTGFTDHHDLRQR
jgi:hypothetical protein